MKKIITLLFITIILFCFTSCEKEKTYDDGFVDGYVEGLFEGEDYIFSFLFNASSSQKIPLSYGDIWETKDFSLTFTDYKNEDDWFLDCQLTLYDFTLDEADKKDNIYIGIYSSTGNLVWNRIVPDYDHYYMYAVLDENYTMGNNTSKATFCLKDGQRYVAAIIVVNGNIYNAVYSLKER